MNTDPNLTISLSSGPVRYRETGSGATGPTVVLLHGLLMDSTLWDNVVLNLPASFRCIAPDLPLGAHGVPMNPNADLSLHGIAALVREFLEHLDLHDVMLVGNDTGGAIVQLLATAEPRPARIGSVGLVSCEAFDNVPPGLTGKTVVTMGRLPQPLFSLVMQQMRLKPMRRLPIAFGWLTKSGDASTKRWMQALLRDKHIQRDAVKVLRGIRADKDALTHATASFKNVSIPVLIAWAKHDRVMPPGHGRRLAEMFQRSHHVEIDNSYTLIPLDQPKALAHELERFVTNVLQTRPQEASR